MLNSKQRAYLKSIAGTEPTIMQVGKGGINENLIKTVGDALEARELIKMSVLDNSEESARGAAEELARATGAEVVTVIGRKIVLYKESEKHKKIFLEDIR